jgi:hypothetical protein
METELVVMLLEKINSVLWFGRIARDAETPVRDRDALHANLAGLRASGRFESLAGASPSSLYSTVPGCHVLPLTKHTQSQRC